MTTIQTVFNGNMQVISGIVQELLTNSDSFDSHKFIKKFSRKFEQQYVQALSENNENPTGAFQKVHLQIGKALSEMQSELKIQGNGKIESANIFGDECENELWRRTE